MSNKVISRAIFSVSDKKGLSDFAHYLQNLGVELISTGGTAKYLGEEGVVIKEVSKFTDFPEMLDGRVKTLHPKIHGGILAIRNNPTHQKEMKNNKIIPIDMVVVNLYPFEETVSSGASESKCFENIDIGGPAMIRSSAKNFMDVVIITDPGDYKKIEEEMRKHSGCVSLKTRKYLAAKAFSKTAFYDSRISRWFLNKNGNNFPELFSLSGTKSKDLRYGENPHQDAALYLTDKNVIGVSNAQQLQGKELSYNNINDTDAACELVKEFHEPAVAIIKHANPCGVAIGETCEQAYLKALRCDTVSAFGGVIAVNRIIDKSLALQILDIFTEVIIAPDFSEDARLLFSKKKNLRLLMTNKAIEPVHNDNQIRLISGGFLLQNKDNHTLSQENLNIVTTKVPTSEQISDMLFAFTVAKHVKSNAIIYVRGGATVGIGAGQMSRVDSSRIAAEKAKEAANKAGISESLAIGSVVASDAFFPFPDGLIAAIDAGAEAVIQPGGSIRDDDVISAANERNIAMIFTGIRHFKH